MAVAKVVRVSLTHSCSLCYVCTIMELKVVANTTLGHVTCSTNAILGKRGGHLNY